MVSQKVTLTNTQGFHMRPAGIFAKEMGKYTSDIMLLYNGKRIDGKSVMNIIAACIRCGSEFEIQCSGEDEQNALKEAVALIESGLGE